MRIPDIVGKVVCCDKAVEVEEGLEFRSSLARATKGMVLADPATRNPLETWSPAPESLAKRRDCVLRRHGQRRRYAFVQGSHSVDYLSPKFLNRTRAFVFGFFFPMFVFGEAKTRGGAGVNKRDLGPIQVARAKIVTGCL